MPSRLFFKLFITLAALNVLSMTCVAWFVSRSQERKLQELTEKRLEDDAQLLEELVKESSGLHAAELHKRITRWASAASVRFSVFDAQGRLVVDSLDQQLKDDLAVDSISPGDRPAPLEDSAPSTTTPDARAVSADELACREIRLARTDGEATVERLSRLAREKMLFYARRLQNEQGQISGFVRTAVFSKDFQSDLWEVNRLIWSIAGVALFGLLIATSSLVSRIVEPVTRLTAAAARMAEGDYRTPIYLATGDELGRLAETFNSMRREMNTRVTQLRETNQRLSTVLGGMTDGVIAIDENQNVLFANTAAGKLMQFQPSSAQGRSLLESVRSHILHELIVKLMAVPGQQQVEMEWGTPKTRNLLIDATSFSDAPSAGIVMVIHNLSEVRRLEAMRRDFVANVSHELKTPLSSIKAYAETLSQGAINDEKNRLKFVRQIEEQSDRLGQLISDLLSLARIESGEEHLDFLLIPVDRIVRQCINEQMRAAEEKQIDLMIDGGDDVRVEADEDALRQILINLIDNAIKYTPAGGQVTVRWRVAADQELVLQVQDTGIGIPEEKQGRVFERFFRVDKARSREIGGTGLGLAIVKHLAQSFDGNVEVESQPQLGSLFTVRIPLRRAKSTGRNGEVETTG